jgi:hypothetical protein
MRAAFVALFLAVLSTSFAVKLGNQQKSLDLAKFKLSSNDFLGDAIKGLLQITAIPETQEVIDIIGEVRTELQGLLHDTETTFEHEQTSYLASKKSYEDTICDLDSKIVNTKAELEEAGRTKGNLEESIQNSLNNKGAAEGQVDTEESRRAEASAAHSRRVSDLSDAIAACDDALALMAEVREKDLPSQPAILLQTHEQKLKSHIQKISEKLQKMTFKGTIGPFLQALVEMTQEGINWQLIDKIIDLIRDLKGSLQHEIEVADQEDSADAEYSQKYLESLHKTIGDEITALQNNGALLETVKSKIDLNFSKFV